MSKGKALHLLRKSAKLGSERKQSKRYEVSFDDFRLHSSVKDQPKNKEMLSIHNDAYHRGEAEEVKKFDADQ